MVHVLRNTSESCLLGHRSSHWGNIWLSGANEHGGFGRDSFIIPSMLGLLLVLSVLRSQLDFNKEEGAHS